MRLEREFYEKSCLEAAPELVGKFICVLCEDGITKKLRITETEAYCGESDTACHAHHGKTKRNAPLYERAGTVYIYLCYGMHWLLNIITGPEGEPQGVLIRACEGYNGPGKLTKALGLNGEYNMNDVCTSKRIWIEDDGCRFDITPAPRVGIGYASLEDQARQWRFIINTEKTDR